MKRIIIIIGFLAVIGCKKDDIRCATCIEERTQYPLEYCGTKKQIEQYEQSLNLVGLSLGQKWECR